MAKDTAGNGKEMLDGVVSGKSTLSDMDPAQLAALGGSRDPIDDEDFSKADFGNDITTSQDDEETKDEEEPAKEEAKDEESEDEEAKEDEAEEAEEEPAKDDAKDDEEEEATEEEPAEEEAEEETTDEETEEDEDEDGKKKDQRVPLDRFREVNKRMRDAEKRVEALEREIAAGKGQQPKKSDEPAPKPYDFDAAEEKYQDLLLDGQRKEAAALRKEIRAAEQAQYTQQAQQVAGQTENTAHDSRVLGVLAEDFERDYPEMDADSEQHDPAVLEQVEALYIGYMNQGIKPPQAFAKAVESSAKMFGLKPVDQRETEKPVPKTKAKVKDTKEVKAKKDAKVAKAKKAPPDVGKAGKGGDSGKPLAKSIDDMDESEFNALPKSTLAKLRGDIV